VLVLVVIAQFKDGGFGQGNEARNPDPRWARDNTAFWHVNRRSGRCGCIGCVSLLPAQQSLYTAAEHLVSASPHRARSAWAKPSRSFSLRTRNPSLMRRAPPLTHCISDHMGRTCLGSSAGVCVNLELFGRLGTCLDGSRTHRTYTWKGCMQVASGALLAGKGWSTTSCPVMSRRAWSQSVLLCWWPQA
jgi:hypothetical protein